MMMILVSTSMIFKCLFGNVGGVGWGLYLMIRYLNTLWFEGVFVLVGNWG